MAGSRNPEIQRLLANLRGSSISLNNAESLSTINHTTLNHNITSEASNSTIGSIPGLGLLPPTDQEHRSAPPSKPSTPQPISHNLQPEPSRERSATPVVPDAATITTWPAALKHVTKHIITNEKAVNKIKHMISEQHKHERQWWAGREAIVTRHSGRAGNQAKVADLLKSLGGASIPIVAHDPKADQAELEAYDKKVYKSLVDMAVDFDRQLRSLQIPFFAIKHDLVILEAGVQDGAAVKGKLDKGELRELQRRMIETLEDLVGDE